MTIAAGRRGEKMKREIIIEVDTNTGTAFDDASELIRCRDCYYHGMNNYGTETYCHYHMIDGWTDDDFCSYSERREDDNRNR